MKKIILILLISSSCTAQNPIVNIYNDANYQSKISNAYYKDLDNTKPESLYQALAWEGLKNTVAWNNLSTTEKNNINTIINNFNISNTNCQ